MTKAQKSLFKQLKKPAHQAGFVQMLAAQQDVMGFYSHWSPAYAKKCLNKGVTSKAALTQIAKAS